MLEDVQVFDTDGTDPRSGIDIEPNGGTDSLANITLRRVLVDGAGGCGIEIKHSSALAASPVPVSILLDSCIVRNIARAGIPIMPLRAGAKGEIRIRNTSVFNTSCAGLLIGDKASDGASVIVESLNLSAVATNCPVGDTHGLAPITFNVTHFHGTKAGPWPPGQTFGGVHFEKTVVRDVNQPFFAVGNVTDGLNWHAVAVDGTVDVYPAAVGTDACALNLGPLGKDVTLRAICHQPP